MNTKTEIDDGPPSCDAACSSAPLTLWLQWYGDSDESETGPVAESEVTHCRDKIFPRDIEYVDAREVRKVLDGHPSSELLGDGGLIAATMRSARIAQRLVMVKVVGGDITEGTITIKAPPEGFAIGDTVAFLCRTNDERVHPYQRRRGSITGFGL